MKSLTLSTLGPAGTFSEKATLKFSKRLKLKDHTILYHKSISEVFESLTSDESQLAIVPIENLSEGFIPSVIDLIYSKKDKIHILGDTKIPVQFSFVSNTIKIKKLYVQFVAEGQCNDFISQLGDIEIINTQSNIESLELLKAEPLECAVGSIVPINAFSKDSYPYSIKNVTDRKNNETRFLLLSKDISMAKGKKTSNKASLLIYDFPNRPGALHDILKVFSDRDVNLTSIISRPTGNDFGEYYFFIDIDSSIGESPILSSIEEVKKTSSVSFLGSY